MNILFLTPRLPFPLIGGDRVKPYHLLKHLAKEHKITLITLYQGKGDPDNYIKEIEKLGIEVIVFKLNPLRAGLSSILKLFTFRPIEILYYYKRSVKKFVHKLISERKFELGISFFMRTAEYLKNENIRKILIAEDSRILYQSRSYRESRNPFQKIIRYYEFLTLKIYEPSIIHHFDKTTFVTAEDISFIKAIDPSARVFLLTNGTDTIKYVPGDFDKRDTILFTGKFDVWANQIMVQRIVRKIMPKIKNHYPDIRFVFAGANPTKYLRNLHANNTVELYENVPSMVPYLQKARVYLHPHTGASGIQNKLIEAMCAGCPVVTTNSGNQGIYGRHGEHLMLGNTDQEITQCILDLLKDDQLSMKISENARHLIENTHSWEQIYSELDSLIKEIMPND